MSPVHRKWMNVQRAKLSLSETEFKKALKELVDTQKHLLAATAPHVKEMWEDWLAHDLEKARMKSAQVKLHSTQYERSKQNAA